MPPAAAASSEQDPASPLTRPSFRRFLAARFSTSLAYQIVSVAVGWQIYSLTGSALDLGLIGLAQFLPMMCLTLLVGHAADRYDRRRIVAICMAIEALATMILAAAALQGFGGKALVYATVVIMSSARAFEAPTLPTLIPAIVPREWIPRATAFSASSNQVAQIAGPALGALRAAPAVGAALMSLMLARMTMTSHVGPLLFGALMLFGVATVVFGVSTSIPVSVAALAVLGAADSISVVVRSSLVQLNTPDEMLGRVSSVNTLFIGTSNQLGEFESGVTAALFGTVPAVVIGGLGTMAVAGLWMWWFPELRKLKSLSTPA